MAILEMRLAEQTVLASTRRCFRIIANADFTTEILTPVIDQVESIADTSELFLRAQQLTRLCESAPRRDRTCATATNVAQATTEQEPRIGKHVRATMDRLAASGRLTARIVGDLLDAKYCKAKFNLGLPFLKAVDRALSLQSQRTDRNGYGRYWKQPLRIGDHEFLMCSQWFVWQRGSFDNWVREIG